MSSLFLIKKNFPEQAPGTVNFQEFLYFFSAGQRKVKNTLSQISHQEMAGSGAKNHPNGIWIIADSVAQKQKKWKKRQGKCPSK